MRIGKHSLWGTFLIAVVVSFLGSPRVYAGGVVKTCNAASLLAALSGGGTVTFACSGTITVPATITIFMDTTIDGSGQNVTISGGGKVEVFLVNALITLNLDHLTVADGTDEGYGGAVSNLGNLYVVYCTFQGNTANTFSKGGGGWGGAIANYGYLNVTNSTFKNNTAKGLGGAIFNSTGATLTNSTFSNNNANGGGAVFTGNSTGIGNGTGFLGVNNCTFNNNSASYAGGGIVNITSYITVITNSTFYANSGGTGGGGNFLNISTYPSVTVLDNDTFDGGIEAGDAGGANIWDQGTSLFVENTILANPSGTINCSGSYVDLGGNLVWAPDGLSCLGNEGNPMLGPLQNNGGPTATMAIGPGSAALDLGLGPYCPATDERGVLRPKTKCDSGAFEYSTAKTMGFRVFENMDWFRVYLLSPIALDRLQSTVLSPLRQSLDPDLWPNEDGNHVNAANVFTLQQAVVAKLGQFIVDPTQLAFVTNLVMADRTLASVALNDYGCNANPNPGINANGPSICNQAEADLAAGDNSANQGDYVGAIGNYESAWQLVN